MQSLYLQAVAIVHTLHALSLTAAIPTTTAALGLCNSSAAVLRHQGQKGWHTGQSNMCTARMLFAL